MRCLDADAARALGRAARRWRWAWAPWAWPDPRAKRPGLQRRRRRAMGMSRPAPLIPPGRARRAVHHFHIQRGEFGADAVGLRPILGAAGCVTRRDQLVDLALQPRIRPALEPGVRIGLQDAGEHVLGQPPASRASWLSARSMIALRNWSPLRTAASRSLASFLSTFIAGRRIEGLVGAMQRRMLHADLSTQRTVPPASTPEPVGVGQHPCRDGRANCAPAPGPSGRHSTPAGWR